MSKRSVCSAAAGALLIAMGGGAGVGVAAQGSGSSQGPISTASQTAPQPPSRADQNGGGANGQCPGGPYCSTRDGSPSQNGSGNGNANGKPCAGCVGKADNKNPQGQLPNGSDRNAGYECDSNSGVGKSNPAHTGCRAAPSPTTTTSTTTTAATTATTTTTAATTTTSTTPLVTPQGPAAPGSPAVPASPPAAQPTPAQSGVMGAQVTKTPSAHAVAPAAKAVTARPSFTG